MTTTPAHTPHPPSPDLRPPVITPAHLLPSDWTTRRQDGPPSHPVSAHTFRQLKALQRQFAFEPDVPGLMSRTRGWTTVIVATRTGGQALASTPTPVEDLFIKKGSGVGNPRFQPWEAEPQRRTCAECHCECLMRSLR